MSAVKPCTPPTADDEVRPFAGRAIAQSAMWRLVEAVGGEGVALVVFVVMARLLVPENFGVVALAGVFIIGSQVLLQQGLPEAVIQGAHASADRLSTAFWCNLGLGAALAAVVIACAYPAAALFAEPVLAPVLATLALGLPLTGAATILQAKLMRRLAFKPIAIRALIATGTGGAVGLFLALGGMGVWALVGLQLAGTASGLAFLALAEPWRPRAIVDRHEARDLIRFALPVMATTFAKFAGKRLDVALLGLFVSASALGYYFLATRLVFALGLATHYAVFALTLPVLARVRSDQAAFRTAAARTLWLTTALCLPAGLGSALVANSLIPLVFGAGWQASVLPLQILAASSIFYALGLICGQIMVAAGNPSLFLRLALANTALFLALVALAAPWGLSAAALAGGLANMLMLTPYLISMQRTTGLSIGALARDQLPIWIAAGLMTGLLFSIETAMAGTLSTLGSLVLAVLLGIVVYFGLLCILARDTVRMLLSHLALRRISPAASTT